MQPQTLSSALGLVGTASDRRKSSSGGANMTHARLFSLPVSHAQIAKLTNHIISAQEHVENPSVNIM